jgi:predicted dehydrogenase/nucleoside-diphosphate-sugar epimerase
MTSRAVPRLAIIGCGALVEHHLLPALRRLGWLPSVLIDTSPKRIKVIAGKMGRKGINALAGSSWQPLSDQFDAAIVAVPHALHFPIGTALLDAGKHVFMEKPLAITGHECRAMIAAAETSGATLSVGLLRRYLRIAQWTRALLESKVLGEVQSFEAREGIVYNWDVSSDAILRPDLAGGGVLMDIGTHTLDLILWWLGNVESFTYRDDSAGGVESDCILDCRLASGATGRVELSRGRNLRNTIRIEGTRGFVEVHLYRNEVQAGSSNALAFRHDGASPADMQPQFFPELFDSELEAFRKTASGGELIGISGREGAKSVELIERCYAARQSLAPPWSDVSVAATVEATPCHILPPGSRVLVTGATGLIGGRLVEQLVQEQGAQVRCLVRSFGSATRIARLPVEIVQADLTNDNDIRRAVDGVDFVFHCAYDPRSLRQNIDGLRHLLDACATRSIRRFVYLSTVSVYEPFPDGLLTEETRDGDRSWIYVNTKLDLERMVFDAVRERNVPATIVQPVIVYGPFARSWTNEPAEMLIFGDVVLPDRAEGLCNAVYVDDLTKGLLLAAVSPAAVGQRFLMSGPEPVTWATFFGEFARALGTDEPKCWPREQIAKANHGIMRDARLVLSNPKKIMQIIVRWQLARRVLQAGLDSLPLTLRTLVMKHYFRSGERRIGELLLPDRQKLALYSARAYVDSNKARTLLGYDPLFDFRRGMALTRQYLIWAYGDTCRAVAAERGRQGPIQAPSP